MSDEREQHRWLGNTLRQSRAAVDGGCVDAEMLAAWVDGGLDASAAATVELHVSNCPQCIAVLAAMERSAPAAPPRHAWTPARLFRWLVPLAAAATAVAIWVVVPDRPVTFERAQDSKMMPAEPAGQIPVPVPIPVPEAAPVPGPAPADRIATEKPGIGNAESARTFQSDARSPERGTTNQEFGTRNAEPAPPEAQFRDEFRRERAAPESLGAATDTAAARDVPATPSTREASQAAAPSVPPAATERTPSAARADASPSVDTRNETVASTAQRSALSKAAASTESIAPANPLFRWRIVASRVERSVNGAKSWTRTRVPQGSPVAIRAVDADRAVLRTSDNAEFYTIDGGRSWTRVQENSAAPF